MALCQLEGVAGIQALRVREGCGAVEVVAARALLRPREVHDVESGGLGIIARRSQRCRSR